MRYKDLVLALNWIAVLAAGCDTKQETPLVEAQVPAVYVRKAVARLSAPQVTEIHLYGLHIKGRLRVVKGASETARLLAALRLAVEPEPGQTNRIDTITIVLKDGREVGPLSFLFGRPIDCFGRPFYETLLALDLVEDRFRPPANDRGRGAR